VKHTSAEASSATWLFGWEHWWDAVEDQIPRCVLRAENDAQVLNGTTPSLDATMDPLFLFWAAHFPTKLDNLKMQWEWCIKRLQQLDDIFLG